MARRYRRLLITESLLLELLKCDSLNGKYIQVPVNSVIPEGCKVISVDKDLTTNCIQVILEHPIFEEVSGGEGIPLYQDFGNTQVRVFKVDNLEELNWFDKLKRFILG